MGLILSKLRSSPLSSSVKLLALFLIYKKIAWVLPFLRFQMGESFRDYLGRIALTLVPAVQKAYLKEVNGQLNDTRKGGRKNWDELGELRTKMPEQGYSKEYLLHILKHISSVTQTRCESNYMSGTIYSYSHWKEDNSQDAQGVEDFSKEVSNSRDLSTPRDLIKLSKDLGELYSKAFHKSYLWNSLHTTEFGVGDWLSYQVVHMAADIYGAAPSENIMGFVTSGGTASLMNAMRSYREWGIYNRGHIAGEGVILCFDSVHAAVDKAGIAYNLHVELIPLGLHDQPDLKALKAALKKFGDRVICIVASTPSYPLGVMEPVREVAEIALKAGVGMHVDSCLGGFVINFLDDIDTRYLSIPGVTSLSCDTHKNGWAPKGSSVLITRQIQDLRFKTINLAYYSYYSIPSWTGGLYGTPANPGSQHVTHVLHAYLAMLAIGKDGYRQIGNMIHKATKDMADIIRKEPRVQILGDKSPKANVIAWRISPEASWPSGAIYAFAHEMSTRNITLSALGGGERVHFCVTGRSAGDPNFVGMFERALKDSLDATAVHVKDVVAGRKAFPGDAGLYGTLNAAMEPTSENCKSRAEYIQNYLLGNSGVKDGIRMYFYGSHDPYSTRNVGE